MLRDNIFFLKNQFDLTISTYIFITVTFVHHLLLLFQNALADQYHGNNEKG